MNEPQARSEAAASHARLVVGLQPVREALRRHGKAVSQLLLLEGNPRLEGLERYARELGVTQVTRVPRSVLERVVGSAQHQGAVAYAPELRLEAAQKLFERSDLAAVALDRIHDPQNFGAVIRSAVGLLGAPVIWGEHSAAPLTPATFRASAGAVEHATLCRVRSLPQFLLEARAEGVEVIGLDSHAPVALSALDLTQPLIIVIGSEGEGMRKSTRRACSTLAHLVRPGKIDSLNASVAAAIALYEVAKIRGLTDS